MQSRATGIADIILPRDERMDGQMDRRTDSPRFLQDFVPFGAAALLPLNLSHTLLKQGTGTADHYCSYPNTVEHR